MRDLTVAYRRLRRSPVFLISSVLLLAVGLGVNAAVFSVMDLLFLRALPLPDSQQLVVLEEYRNGRKSGSNALRLADWKARVASFSNAASVYGETAVLEERDGNRAILTLRVVGDWLGLMGLPPLEGRLFRGEEARGGNVAVLTERGRGLAAIGQTLRVGGASYEVVGVVGNAAAYGDETQVILPAPEAMYRTSRKAGFLSIAARIRPAVTFAAAQAEASGVAAKLGQEYPETDKGTGVRLVSAQTAWTEQARNPALWIEAAAGLLLLITIVNLAGLFAARAMERHRESAVRIFLGAERLDLIRLHLAEAGLLVGAGCAAALLVAPWALSFLQLMYAADFPLLREAVIDARVIGFLIAVASLSCIAFAVAMAWQSSREKGVRNAAHFRLRSGLIVIEAALGLLLMAVAIQLVQDFRSMENGPRGFRSQGIVGVKVNFPWDMPTPQLRQLAKQGMEEMSAIPGVSNVGVVDAMPLEGGTQDGQLFVRGAVEKTPEEIGMRMASANYFELMGIPLLAGQLARRKGEIVVNDNFAKRYLAGSVIGREVSPDGKNWWRVVGVIGNVRVSPKEKQAMPQIYMRAEDSYWPKLSFALKTAGGAADIAGPSKRIWANVSPLASVASVKDFENRLEEVLAQPKRQRDIIGIFGILALLLVITGVYGVMASEMAQRTKEIGIRVAIGASRADVMTLALKRGLMVALIACGLGAALGTALLSQWVMWSAIAGGTLSVMAGVLLAAFVPAWRASRIDPAIALRNE